MAYVRALQLSQNAQLDDVPEETRPELSQEPVLPDFRQVEPGADSPFGSDNCAVPQTPPASRSLPDTKAPPDIKASELESGDEP